jgi:predicted component of type VI protein secretion system
MNYDVQEALRRKVDDYQFHALEQKVGHLENENRELTRALDNAKGRLENQYRAIDSLIQMMIEREVNPEISYNVDALYNLKNYL